MQLDKAAKVLCARRRAAEKAAKGVKNAFVVWGG